MLTLGPLYSHYCVDVVIHMYLSYPYCGNPSMIGGTPFFLCVTSFGLLSLIFWLESNDKYDFWYRHYISVQIEMTSSWKYFTYYMYVFVFYVYFICIFIITLLDFICFYLIIMIGSWKWYDQLIISFPFN